MKLNIACLFLVGCLSLDSPMFSKQTLVYKSVTGGKTTDYIWTIQKKDNRYLITSEGGGTTVKIEGITPYQIENFDSTTPKKERVLGFQLEKQKLVASNETKGIKDQKVYTIESSPWVQEFEFGLQEFIRSKKDSFQFVILNPKNLDLHEMVAKKKGTETIQINGTSRDALVVKVTLIGFKSMFWKAMLWYDASTHDLLVYKSNEGPHTPTTVVTLESKKGTPESTL